LDRCIASIVRQSYGDLDIVLVDDGSADGGEEICRRWERGDKRVTYIRQDNAGPGAARNNGMSVSPAGYVTFLDSDDWFEPAFVEKIMRAMLDSGSDVGLCDMYYVDSVKPERRQRVKIRFGKEVVSSREDKSVVNKSRLFTWGKIYRRRLFSECDFRFPDIVYEDTCVPILIARANQVHHVPEPLINYFRHRAGSLSNDSDKIGDIARGLRMLYDRFNALGIYDEYALEYKKIALGQLRYACRKWGDFGSAAKALSELERFVGRLIAGHAFAAADHGMGDSADDAADVAADDATDDATDVAADHVAQAKNLTEIKYFAFGNRTLAAALDKAVPYPWQIVSDIERADRVVVLERDAVLAPEDPARLMIRIPEDAHAQGAAQAQGDAQALGDAHAQGAAQIQGDAQALEDAVMAEFNLAELIMERII
jgi:glycosyltransferase involved in cell wall biosynthesis